jgi:hypothetical protein
MPISRHNAVAPPAPPQVVQRFADYTSDWVAGLWRVYEYVSGPRRILCSIAKGYGRPRPQKSEDERFPGDHGWREGKPEREHPREV